MKRSPLLKKPRRGLNRLLLDYAKTTYGKEHGANQIETLADYRGAFPIATYEDYKPLLDRVMEGEVDLLLWEPPIGWAITRGTTKGEFEIHPYDSHRSAHACQRWSCCDELRRRVQTFRYLHGR